MQGEWGTRGREDEARTMGSGDWARKTGPGKRGLQNGTRGTGPGERGTGGWGQENGVSQRPLGADRIIFKSNSTPIVKSVIDPLHNATTCN